MKTIQTPEWLRRRWEDIVKAAVGEIGSWARAYSHGYIKADKGDFPKEVPAEFPLWDPDSEVEGFWMDWPHKDLYAEIRTVYDTGFRAIATGEYKMNDREYPEFHLGTYAVFRVTKAELDRMNEGYDNPGTEHERILEDGDHRIVVYIL